MAQYGLPIWIHPAKETTTPDYPGEKESKYVIFLSIGRPYETSVAMSRLVFSGALDKVKGVKLITHHGGGMVSLFRKRLMGMPRPGLSRPAAEYFKMFYVDNATIDTVSGLMCDYDLFGAERMVLGTDMPYVTVDATLDTVASLRIAADHKEKVMAGNARKLLHNAV